MAHVTIEDTPSYVKYDVTTSDDGPFTVPFAIFDEADLSVEVDGVDIGTAFSFTPTGSATGGYQAGAVTLDTAVANAEVLIYRNITPARTSDYGVGPLPKDAVNSEFDKVQAQIADLRRDVTRSAKVDFGEDPNDLVEAIQGLYDELDTLQAAAGLVSTVLAGARLVVTSAVNFYVDADGGDNSNTGLSEAQSFLTPQKAVDTVCANYDLRNAPVYIHLLPASNPYSVTQLKAYGGTWDPDPGTPVGGAPDAAFTCPRIIIYEGATIEGADGLGAFLSVQAHPAWCIVLHGFVDGHPNGYGIQADYSSTIYVAGSDTSLFGNCGQGVFRAQWNSQIEILRGSTLGFAAGGGSDILARVSEGGQILAQAGGTAPVFLLRRTADNVAATSYADCPNFETATCYADSLGYIDLSAVTWSGVSNGGYGAVELRGGIVADKHLIKSRVVSSASQYVTDRRTKLQGNTNFYINRSTGNDGYDGLSATANADTHRGPFATPTALLDYIARYIDNGGYAVNIYGADGTYSPTPIAASLPFVGGGPVTIYLNTSTPANTDFNCSGVGPAISLSNAARLNIQGGRFACSDNNIATVTGVGTMLTMNGVHTSGATAGSGYFADNGGEIHVAANYNLTANQAYHLFAADGGAIFVDGGTGTITGSPTFTDFAYASNHGRIIIASSGVAWSGAVGGGRIATATALGLVQRAGVTVPGTGVVESDGGEVV